MDAPEVGPRARTAASVDRDVTARALRRRLQRGRAIARARTEARRNVETRGRRRNSRGRESKAPGDASRAIPRTPSRPTHEASPQSRLQAWRYMRRARIRVTFRRHGLDHAAGLDPRRRGPRRGRREVTIEDAADADAALRGRGRLRFPRRNTETACRGGADVRTRSRASRKTPTRTRSRRPRPRRWRVEIDRTCRSAAVAWTPPGYACRRRAARISPACAPNA